MYVRFRVSGVSGTVTRATLRVRTVGARSGGPLVARLVLDRLGRKLLQHPAAPSRLGIAHAELDDASFHHRGGARDVAVGVRQLGQLTEERAVGGQPKSELLGEGDRLGGKLLLLGVRDLAWFEVA